MTTTEKGTDMRVPPSPDGTTPSERTPERQGGPWTRHGHVIAGLTLAGPGRPPVARCGGPGLCGKCSAEGVRLLAAATAEIERESERVPVSGATVAALDLYAIEAEFLQQCGSCDAGLPMGCACSPRDFRGTMLALVVEVGRLTGSLEVVGQRLAEPIVRAGQAEDAIRMARLHIEAALAGRSRPLALATARAEAAEAERDALRAKVAAVEAGMGRIQALAEIQAISCQAQHRADHARSWLDVLAIIERAALATGEGE